MSVRGAFPVSLTRVGSMGWLPIEVYARETIESKAGSRIKGNSFLQQSRCILVTSLQHLTRAVCLYVRQPDGTIVG